MRELAELLVFHETPENDCTADFRVTERLRPYMAKLMGNGGFRALLARALALAGAEIAWLREIKVEADGRLVGLSIPLARIAPAEWREGQVVLLVHMLELLAAFIGPALTLRLLAEIWPRLAMNRPDFGEGAGQ